MAVEMQTVGTLTVLSVLCFTHTHKILISTPFPGPYSLISHFCPPLQQRQLVMKTVTSCQILSTIYSHIEMTRGCCCYRH